MISKISGILPTSARIESADFKSERPVRSGVPGIIGQPVSQAFRRGSAVQTETVGGLRPTDIENAINPTGPKSDESIVEELSNQFFSRNRDAIASDEGMPQQPTGGSLSIRI